MSLVHPGRSAAPAHAAPATSRTTLVVSLAAHVVVALAVVIAPIFAQVRLPAPSKPIAAYVTAAAYTEVPIPTAAGRPDARPGRASTVPATTTSSAAAPTTAPTTIAEGAPPAPPSPVGLPAGIAGSTLGAAIVGLPAPPSPPPPPSTRPLRVGGDIRAPRKLHHVAPTYPSIAAQARVTGTVILEATISPTGAVTDVRVLRSVPLLDAAAVEAVRQWRYEAPLLNGRPIAVLLTVTVRFAP